MSGHRSWKQTKREMVLSRLVDVVVRHELDHGVPVYAGDIRRYMDIALTELEMMEEARRNFREELDRLPGESTPEL